MATAPSGNQVVELLFKVAGGAALNGLSGKGIKDDISGIVSELQKQSVTELTFKVSDASLKSIREQIKKSVQNIPVTFDGKSIVAGDNTDTGNPTNKQSNKKSQINEILKLYKEQYNILTRIAKLDSSKDIEKINVLQAESSKIQDKINKKIKEYNIEAEKTPAIMQAIADGQRRVQFESDLNFAGQVDTAILQKKNADNIASIELQKSRIAEINELYKQRFDLESRLVKLDPNKNIEETKILQSEISKIQDQIAQKTSEYNIALSKTPEILQVITDGQNKVKNAQLNASIGTAKSEDIKFLGELSSLENDSVKKQKQNLNEIIGLYREYYSLVNSAAKASGSNKDATQAAYLKEASSVLDLIIQKEKDYNIEANKTPEIQAEIAEGFRKIHQTSNVMSAKQSATLTSSDVLDKTLIKINNIQKSLQSAQLYDLLPSDKISEYQNQLNIISGRFTALAGSSNQFATNFNNVNSADLDNIIADVNNLSFSLERAKQETTETSSVFVKYENSFAKLANRAQDYLTKITPSLKRSPEMFTELNNLVNQLRSGEGFSSVAEGSLAFQDLQFRIKQAGLETQTLGQQIEDIFKNKLGYGIIATAALYARSTMRELVSTVIELDTKLTELQIVSGESGQTMVKYMDDAAEGAKRVASSITDIIDATTVFRRLGFELQDSLNFAELTTMYSKVGGVEIGEAESNITAIIKAFNLSTSDLELALDKMVTTGKVYCPTA